MDIKFHSIYFLYTSNKLTECILSLQDKFLKTNIVLDIKSYLIIIVSFLLGELPHTFFGDTIECTESEQTTCVGMQEGYIGYITNTCKICDSTVQDFGTSLPEFFRSLESNVIFLTEFCG